MLEVLGTLCLSLFFFIMVAACIGVAFIIRGIHKLRKFSRKLNSHLQERK